jgi:hypothetical protein
VNPLLALSADGKMKPGPGISERREETLMQSSGSLTTADVLPGNRCSTRTGPTRDATSRAHSNPRPNLALDLDVHLWGGEDLNLRPTDYESAALTD